MSLQNNASLEMVQNIIEGVTPPQDAGHAWNADKLNTDAGSSTRPVYFDNGVPVQCSSTLSVSISGSAASAANATNAGHATSADTATSASSADRATDDGYGRNIANTYVLKGEEGWGLNLYACTVSFSTTAAIYFLYPYSIFSFDVYDIAEDLFRKGMRSNNQAFPVVGIEPGGEQVVGMYSKNGSSITLAVITGAQLTEMSLPSGTLNKSSYT